MDTTIVAESKVLKKTPDYTVLRTEQGLEFYINEQAKQLIRFVELTNKIRQLPFEDLKEFAYTKDLEDLWNYERQFSYDLGFCMLIKYFNLDWEIAENQITDKLILNLIDAITAQYEALGKLIKNGFRVLKKFLPQCPTRPEDLLLQIISQERSLPFEIVLISDYIEYQPTQLEAFFEQLVKVNISKVSLDADKLKKLQPIHARVTKCNPLIGRVLRCIESHYWENPTHLRLKIEYCANVYNSAERYLCETMTEMLRARNSSGKICPTIVWKNGRITFSSYGRQKHLTSEGK